MILFLIGFGAILLFLVFATVIESFIKTSDYSNVVFEGQFVELGNKLKGGR